MGLRKGINMINMCNHRNKITFKEIFSNRIINTENLFV